jgi:hypothetical protein
MASVSAQRVQATVMPTGHAARDQFGCSGTKELVELLRAGKDVCIRLPTNGPGVNVDGRMITPHNAHRHPAWRIARATACEFRTTVAPRSACGLMEQPQ